MVLLVTYLHDNDVYQRIAERSIPIQQLNLLDTVIDWLILIQTILISIILFCMGLKMMVTQVRRHFIFHQLL